MAKIERYNLIVGDTKIAVIASDAIQDDRVYFVRPFPQEALALMGAQGLNVVKEMINEGRVAMLVNVKQADETA